VSLSPKVVLVIDDDKDTNELMCEVARMRGLSVLSAETRTEAVPLLDQSPDIVLMDCQMPGMSAADFLQVVRQKKAIPIILVTAVSDGLEKAERLKVEKYFAKPFDVAALGDCVEALLKPSQP
jgi:DNA-binding response OmpR family regulator